MKGVINQRSPAEHGSGPFEGPSSYPQLCWWSLIPILNVRGRIEGMKIRNAFFMALAISYPRDL
jgi:hypothetical protein